MSLFLVLLGCCSGTAAVSWVCGHMAGREHERRRNVQADKKRAAAEKVLNEVEEGGPFLFKDKVISLVRVGPRGHIGTVVNTHPLGVDCALCGRPGVETSIVELQWEKK